MTHSEETVVKEVDTDAGLDETENGGLDTDVGRWAVSRTENVCESVDLGKRAKKVYIT